MDTKVYTAVVQLWLKRSLEDNIVAEQSHTAWSKAASTSVKELLRPLANTLTRCWLFGEFGQKPIFAIRAWDAIMTFAVGFLPAYNKMVTMCFFHVFSNGDD